MGVVLAWAFFGQFFLGQSLIKQTFCLRCAGLGVKVGRATLLGQSMLQSIGID